ncbi:MAG: CARDB domain-containing protein [Isosphaeraceae bacterium]|nr:CARDB domain-containing protein [Isosphaeraceae bacterium]
MSSRSRRPDVRRRAWGRGPIILPFDALERRELLSGTSAEVSTVALPDLIATKFDTSTTNVDWGGGFGASGFVQNQGDGPTTEPVTVTVYASPINLIGPRSQPIGSFTIPAGLGAGASHEFRLPLNLPLAPIEGVGPANQNSVWVNMRVDSGSVLTEKDHLNNEGRGLGKDTSIITITPPLPSNLVGSSIAVSPASDVKWGQTITVTAQVRNNAQGMSPTTRARLVLTPAGTVPGTVADVTIGSIQVPPIPAWQTANVTQQVTLPAGPASTLAAANNFILTMVQDADYVTNPMNNRAVAAGLGIDQVILAIGANPDGYIAPGRLPDLAPSAIAVSNVNLVWGTSFVASATIQNLGLADAPSFRVRFLLAGTDGTLNQAVVLGDTIVPGLAAGATASVNPTLSLPRRLPFGSVVSSLAYGRIVVMVDPEQSVDQTVRTNDSAASAPVLLRVLGTDGTSNVPTGPAISYTPTNTAATPATPTETTPKKTPRQIRAEKIAKIKERQAARRLTQRKPHYQKQRPAVQGGNSVIDKVNSFGDRVADAFKSLTDF